jgi:hypothetical protein
MGHCNAECASCGEGIVVKGDGSTPWTKVPAGEDRLRFCNHMCMRLWCQVHCAWCGMTPRQTVLTIDQVVGAVTYKFCDSDHLTRWHAHQQPSAIVRPLWP